MSNRIETANSLSVGIGTIALYHIKAGWAVKVKVIDMRQRYGIVDALIQPIEGIGQTWIEARQLLVVANSETGVTRVVCNNSFTL